MFLSPLVDLCMEKHSKQPCSLVIFFKQCVWAKELLVGTTCSLLCLFSLTDPMTNAVWVTNELSRSSKDKNFSLTHKRFLHPEYTAIWEDGGETDLISEKIKEVLSNSVFVIWYKKTKRISIHHIYLKIWPWYDQNHLSLLFSKLEIKVIQKSVKFDIKTRNCSIFDS